MLLAEKIVISTAVFFFLSMLLFAPLEWLLRARNSPPAPLGDWIHFWVNSMLVPAAAVTVMAAIGAAVRYSLPHGFVSWIQTRPLWLQFIVVIALAETWSYWAHRLAHRVPLLWRFHREHHSIEHMSWVSALRQHPFDAIWIMAAANIPAFALGIDLTPIAGFILFERCYTVLLHTNLDFSFGWFDHILSSTRFHHWHHESGPKGRNRNFAGMFSLLDSIFGTYHETGRAPAAFGPAKLAPRSYWGQIATPLGLGMKRP
jgi:sterol desaturase/sphingolipid hydroxylase (fatty acid hydroxylase superfamily)